MNKAWTWLSCGLLLLSISAEAADAKKGAAAKQSAKKRGLVEEADQNVSGQGYGMAGCGLGSILFGQKEGMIQVVAATFNGTAGNQTFAISTGTSNCKAGSKGERSAALFIEVNREAVAKDISRGSGESIETLTEILGCHDSNKIGEKLQSSFSEIFPTANVSSEQASKKIFELIQTDETLSTSCEKVG